jgi:type IV secretion system protein TrbF
MSIATAIKKVFFKQPDETMPPETSENPQKPEATYDNPYLNARRSWNDHVGEVLNAKQTWQVIGILSLMIALASVGGIIHIGSQSKFVPYVVEVDKLGQPLAISPAQLTSVPDPRVVSSSVASFINDARIVTPDVALQRKAIFRMYSMLSAKDPATMKANEWLNGSDERSPFKRAEKMTVSIEIHTVIAQTPDTWQVDWVETEYDRDGSVLGAPFRMRALVTVYTVPSTPETTVEQLRMNPMGIYVRDFSWSKQP